ncbi:MAG: hypothetical protein Q4G24_07885 [Paracoccus sp. (in: a-proteobacteria)]|uniref:hypothetical protein n=1 Tax=Paracoccus sp. TaxID=267 RepID=UPI0026DFC4C0|nr:hypothetical protein [Paracoccus sp. (in: a-proteobacteria)]MDO5621374.1 hypothetical protein [Paracoccus sp. (in: a-proteobacteria)]
MPQLIRLYIRNIAIGLLLALIFTALLIGFDVARLRHLVLNNGAVGVIAVVMLVVFNTIVFAAVQFAIAVMRMADDGAGPKSGRRIRAGDDAPISAPARVVAGVSGPSRR